MNAQQMKAKEIMKTTSSFPLARELHGLLIACVCLTLLPSPAHASDDSPYSDFLWVNAEGVVHIEFTQFRRDGFETYQKLLDEVERDLKAVETTAERIFRRLRIVEFETTSVFQMLHSATAETLDKLARGDDGTIRQVDILSGVLTQYAHERAHDTRAPGDAHPYDLLLGNLPRHETEGRKTIMRIGDLAFSPDGSRLASGGEDRTLRCGRRGRTLAGELSDEQAQALHERAVRAWYWEAQDVMEKFEQDRWLDWW